MVNVLKGPSREYGARVGALRQLLDLYRFGRKGLLGPVAPTSWRGVPAYRFVFGMRPFIKRKEGRLWRENRAKPSLPLTGADMWAAGGRGR